MPRSGDCNNIKIKLNNIPRVVKFMTNKFNLLFTPWLTVNRDLYSQ